MIQHRREIKYSITNLEAEIIKSRLRILAEPDKNGTEKGYRVQSLYFDTINDKCLMEKRNGLGIKSKYRLRYYNNDNNTVKLEHKITDLDNKIKTFTTLDIDKARKIVTGDIDWINCGSDNNLDIDNVLQNFYINCQTQALRPKLILSYNRVAYTYTLGDVRITIDSDISSSYNTEQFLTDTINTQKIPGIGQILEIKYSNFIPSLLGDILNLESLHFRNSISKYNIGREYI